VHIHKSGPVMGQHIDIIIIAHRISATPISWRVPVSNSYALLLLFIENISTTTKHTNLDARYSTPRATWYPNETRSLHVSMAWLVMVDAAAVTGVSLYSTQFNGRRSRRKSRRLPCGAYSTITYTGPASKYKIYYRLNHTFVRVT